MPRRIAYLRVSTLNQNLEKNKADILHLANEKNFGPSRICGGKDSPERYPGEKGRLLLYGKILFM
jgi:DNA invertase Pin-like site-specific DNA recombinase